MTLSIDIDDLDQVDGGETITVTQAVTLTEQTVAGALKRPLSLRELEFFAGTLAHGDVKFNLPVANTEFAPDADDVITDADGQDWDVKAVDLLSLGTRYRCWCKQAPTV
jgi:hypothetical protein